MDVYRFTARARQRVGFDVDGASGDSPDTHVRLFAADGSELAANDDDAGPGEAAGKSSYVEFTFSAPGEYWAAVSAAPNRAYGPVSGGGDMAGGTTGGYTLTLTDRTPVSAADTDDQLVEAAAVEVGGAKTDAIAGGTDVDVFSFTALAGQRVGFDVDNVLTSRLDSYLRVFAANGSELAANDDAAAPGEAIGKAASLEFRFSASGTYFAVVSGSPNAASDVFTGGNDGSGSTGEYTRRLTDLSRPPDARTCEAESATLSGAVASAGNPGFSGTGYADYSNATGDYVEWAIDVASAGRYELAFRYANGGAADRRSNCAWTAGCSPSAPLSPRGAAGARGPRPHSRSCSRPAAT